MEENKVKREEHAKRMAKVKDMTWQQVMQMKEEELKK